MRIRYEEMPFDRRSEQALHDIIAINRLLKQLSSRAPEVDWAAVARVLLNGTMVIARDLDSSEDIVAMGTIVFGYKLTAVFASIEDVVVDENYRRRGIGEQITRILLKKAQERGVVYVDLTSNPRRVAANSLYQKIGFKVRETNPYRMEIDLIDNQMNHESLQSAILQV